MEHPLENYRIIGTANYIKKIHSDFWGKKYEGLKDLADGININKEAGTIEVVIINQYPEEGEDIASSHTITLTDYFIESYDVLEKEVQKRMDTISISIPDKTEVISDSIIKELKLINEQINVVESNKQFEILQVQLSEKVKLFIIKLEQLYSKNVFVIPSNKIQWLGNTNVLATLIYDLWKGQDKGKNETSTKPLIKADKKDLENLLINNFIDKNGKSLTISTVSDYLSTNKEKAMKRAKKGIRIELHY